MSHRCGGTINISAVEILVLRVPLGRSLVVGTAEFLVALAGAIESRECVPYVEGARLLHLLLLSSDRAHAPPPGVEVALHDDALDLSHNAVVTRRHLDSRHLRIGERNGLTLGRHEHNLLVDLDSLFEAQQARQHKLGSVTDGVDRAVLDNNTLVAHQEALERRDDLAQVGLVAVVVIQPLGVEDVVQSNEVLSLVHGSTPHTAQLLHVRTDTQQKTQVHAQSTNVGSGLAAHPEHAKLPLIVVLVQLALVDGSDTELTLNGRNEWGSLEQSSRQCFQSARKLRLAPRQLVVQADNAHILFSSSLLGLDETGGAVDADNQTTSDLGVESTTVSGLFNSLHGVS